jgi:hypothetical protein
MRNNSLFRDEELYPPTANLAEAEAFLRAIDPETSWDFISIKESPIAPKSAWALPEEFNATNLNEVGFILQNANSYSGIFARLNSDEKIRVIWRSNTDKNISNAFTRFTQPSCVVSTTPGTWLAYWIVDGWENDEEGRKDFYRATGRLPDTAVDAYHRLPGFWSNRDEARFVVKTRSSFGYRYTREQLLQAWGV